MADPLTPLQGTIEVFSTSIEQFISALGKGISDAQRALDANSIQTQETLASDPVASRYGLQATWYQFPRAELNLKLAVSVARDASGPSAAPSAVAAGPRALLPLMIAQPVRIVAQPVSASYQTHFNYDAQAASSLTISIVPVPPERTGISSQQARLTPDAVQAAALSSAAKFLTVKDVRNRIVPAATDAKGNVLRFDINFNGTAGLWYVLQYAPSDPTVSAIVVAVDDQTGSVRIVSSP